MTVEITNTGSQLVVRTPYTPEFPAQAHKIGGNWDGATKTWFFDPRDEQRVRELCRALFGTAGAEDEGELLTARIVLAELSRPHFFESMGDSRFANQIRWCGRMIATRRGRDSEVKLGSGVRLLTGRFEDSAGSMKNPELGDVDGIELEVRDVPKIMFERLPDTAGAHVIDNAIDRDALAAERLSLLARLTEIDALLGTGM